MPQDRENRKQQQQQGKKKQLGNPEGAKIKNMTKEKKKKAKSPEQEEIISKDNGNNNNNNEEKSEKQVSVSATSNNNSNKRKLKDVFPFGNYRNYYGYRIGQGSEEDPRVKVLKREWFEGKDCLDIGCNSGIITIQIAKKFHCQSMLGVDIDSDRISDARWHLRKIMRAECAGKHNTKASRLEAKEKVISVERTENARDSSPSEGSDLFNIVSFRQENFVLSWYPPEKHYDTILCLSVTKWVHLNWGDDGLITLFSKIWRLLHPGGILVLEPQPWKSYEKNRLVSETTSMNYRKIMFPPGSFQGILLEKIGFRRVVDITPGWSGTKTGFDRPIFAFYK